MRYIEGEAIINIQRYLKGNSGVEFIMGMEQLSLIRI